MAFLRRLGEDLATNLPTWLPIFAVATVTVFRIVLLAMIIALSVGLLLALGRRSARRGVAWLCVVYLEGMRGIPAFAFLYFVYLGLPSLGISLSAFQAAVVALGLNAAAYMAEIYRAGIDSVHIGQRDAALAIGMTSGQAMRHVVMPQALRVIFPPTTNMLVEVIKGTALASAIGAPEIMNRAIEQTSITFTPMAVYVTAGATYLALTLPCARFGRWLERRAVRERAVAPS